MSTDTELQQQTVGYKVENWTERPALTCAPLLGKYCRLEPLDSEKHFKDLAEVFVGYDIASHWTYLSYGPFATPKEFGKWLIWAQAQTDKFFFAVIDQVSELAVGMTSYLGMKPEFGSVEIGHINFSPRLRRRTAATEAIYLMMKRPFDDLGYRRVEWQCDCLNLKSRRAGERFGFTFEGVLRQTRVYKGRNRDSAWFSVLDSEWDRVKQGFEAWLDADNFDTDGVQKATLRACRELVSSTHVGH